MPAIMLKVNVPVSEEKETVLKTKLGEAIGLIPGKSENWLMVCIEDNQKLYFRGSNAEKLAFAVVKLLGKAKREDYERLTGGITEIMETELGIAHTYVQYEETEHWGYNGNNF